MYQPWRLVLALWASIAAIAGYGATLKGISPWLISPSIDLASQWRKYWPAGGASPLANKASTALFNRG